MTGDDEARVTVWDVAGARPRATFEGHAGRINGVALSPDSRTAYSASLDGTVIAWDIAGTRRLGRAFRAVPGEDVRTVSETGLMGLTPASYNISVSPDGDTLSVGEGDGRLSLIDTRTLEHTARFRVGDKELNGGAAFSPDGRTFVTTDGSGTLTFWDARTRTRLGRPIKLSEWPLWPARYSADGRWLAVAGADSIVRILDVRRRTVVQRLEMDQQTRDMAMRPDGKALASRPRMARDRDSSTSSKSRR